MFWLGRPDIFSHPTRNTKSDRTCLDVWNLIVQAPNEDSSAESRLPPRGTPRPQTHPNTISDGCITLLAFAPLDGHPSTRPTQSSLLGLPDYLKSADHPVTILMYYNQIAIDLDEIYQREAAEQRRAFDEFFWMASAPWDVRGDVANIWRCLFDNPRWVCP